MKKTAVMILAGAALVAGTAGAADVSVSADFASAYIFRGVTFNNGLVFQPGAEISGFPIPEAFGSIAVGTWANYDIGDYNGALKGNEFSEIDYYLSYSLPVSIVDLGVTYTEYTYPNGGTADREVAFSVGKAIGESGLYPSLTVNYGLDGAPKNSWYIQGGLEYGVDLTEGLSLSVDVTAAYLINDTGKDGFNDATASLGLSYALTENWALNGSVNYVAQLNDSVLGDTPAGEPLATGTFGYDKLFYATLGVSCDF